MLEKCTESRYEKNTEELRYLSLDGGELSPSRLDRFTSWRLDPEMGRPQSPRSDSEKKKILSLQEKEARSASP
jgi:hypothetical protein